MSFILFPYFLVGLTFALMSFAKLYQLGTLCDLVRFLDPSFEQSPLAEALLFLGLTVLIVNGWPILLFRFRNWFF